MQSFKPSLQKIRQNNHAVLIANALILIGIAGLVGSGFLYLDTKSSAPTSPATSVDVSSMPSSKKISKAAVDSYSVAPTLPKFITLPTIGVNKTRIISLGLLSNGQIATPSSIFDTGWYQASSKPGQAGAMFIYGHVSSWTANGVFYNLKKLKAGDSLSVTRGDNKIFTYHVVSTKIYPYDKVDMNQVLAPIDPKQPGLNLMTCTGKIIKGTSEFSQRLVVFTTQTSS